MRLEHVDADVIQAWTNSAVQELWLPLVFVNLYDKLLLLSGFLSCQCVLCFNNSIIVNWCYCGLSLKQQNHWHTC